MTPDLSNSLIAQFDAITFHFDGNNNDKDDIAALPIAASIAQAAGLENKTTFFYGNNLSEANNANQVAAMRESAAFAEKLGIDSYSYQDGIQQTTDRLVSILDSGQKVLAIEGGPMEAIYQALEQTSPENRSNVALLSHSSWNENRNKGTRPGGGTPRTWSDIRANFPEVTQIDIRDQNNGSNNDRGFNSFMWEWLDTTDNPVLKEARRLMENAQGKVNDPSDAGMLFYAITGQETANPDDAKTFFDAYPPSFSEGAYDDEPVLPPLTEPTPEPDPNPNPEPDPNPNVDPDPMPDSDSGLKETLIRFALVNSETNEVVEGYEDLSAIAQIDLNGLDIDNYSVIAQINPNHPDADKVESVAFESSLGNQTENIVPYALFGDRNGDFHGKALTPGDVEIKATAYTGNRGKGEAIATANIAYSIIDSTPPANDPVAPAPEPPASDSNPDSNSDSDSDSPPDTDMGNDAPPAATGDLISFALVNAATDEIVDGYGNLGDVSEINLAGLNVNQYSIVAQVNPDHPDAAKVESIRFESNLGNQTENIVPYALFGDRNGDFHGKALTPGDVEIKATAYTENRGKGEAIESVTLNYSIVDVSNAEMPVAEMPNTDAPESDPPASDAPESDPPASDAPASDAPASDTPESDTPESEMPDAEMPDADGQGIPMPESDQSEVEEAEAGETEADTPEAHTPDAEMPDAEMPEMPEMADSEDADGGESEGHSMDDHSGDHSMDDHSGDHSMDDHSGNHSTGENPVMDGDDLMDGHGEHMAHLDDPSKHREHMALFDLVPHEDATHVAFKDGSWFDPSTWAGGVIPGDDARVVIPKGITVDYDGVSDADLFTLRVDGQLDFATDQNTQMVIDTFVVAPSGTLTIGSVDNPVQAAVDTRIIIADNGAIDIGWDPQQLSRGIVSHGTVEIHGAEKTSHLKLAEDAMAGDTELTLAEAPEGWQVGDRLVLTGTRYVKDQWNGSEMVWQGTQDEELTIKDIQGNTILLNEALQYDHDTPKDSLKASVANYSRNVVIEMENHDNLPANQRGHIMFMHSDDVDVRYAEFYELGRTDKSKRIDDFKMQNGRRVLDADGNPIKNDPEDITNQRGRYAVHFHRTGVDNPDGEAAIAIGNSVWGSPGWGYAHHDSHLILEDNAAYDVFGSAFVTETGNETGAWRNNIAIKSEGMRSISKRDYRVNNQDIAHNGTGFWFQGRLVENEGNIAAGQRHAGITYLMRGVDQMDVLAENLPNPEIARYEDTLGTGKPPINGFQDNEVMASGMGFEVIKANPRQGHDIRSVIDGFTAWEVRTGTHLEYTSKYTLKDITVIGAESQTRQGISFGNNAEDMVINGAYVEGFKTGVEFKKSHTFKDFNGDWQYTLIDTELVDNDTNFKNLNPSEDKMLTGDDLVAGRLSFTPDANADFVLSPDRNDRKVVITGTKTDSIGTVELPTGSDSLVFQFDGLKERLQQGYFVDAEGTRFFTVKETFADRATGEMLTQEYVVTLTDDWNEFTLGGTLRDVPELATYDGVVTPGLVSDELDTWLDQQWGTGMQGSENQPNLVSTSMGLSIDSATGDSDTGDSDTGDSDIGDSDIGDSDTGASDAGDLDIGDLDTGAMNESSDDASVDSGVDADPAAGSPDSPTTESTSTPGMSPTDALSAPEFAQAVLELTNEFREKNGRSPLSLNQDLTEAAQDHVEDMAKDDFFSHTGKDGSSVLDRVQDAGYAPRAVGENIAAGQTTPEQVVQGWINSPGHRANMLSDNFTEIGIGYDFLANDTGSVNYNHYWAQVFGQSRSGVASPSPSPDSGTDAATEPAMESMPQAQETASPLNLSGLESYGGSGQDKALSMTPGNDNTSVRMEGNGWRKLQVNHTITPETMLSFEFRSDTEGEIHSIGFDNDNSIGQGDRRTSFQLFGVQNWGNRDFETYMAQSGWQSFKIPVGEYLSGEMAFLTLGNDQDIANPDANSEFRNIMLYEADGSHTLGSNSSPQEDALTGAMDSTLTTLTPSSDVAGLPM